MDRNAITIDVSKLGNIRLTDTKLNFHRRLLLCRRWYSLSRLQRSLVTLLFCAVLVTSMCYLIFLPIKDVDEEAAFLNKDDAFKNYLAKKVLPSRLTTPSRMGLKFNGPQNSRQLAVVEAFKHAWRGYTEFAWGHDHLLPVSKSYDDWFGLGLTIVDSLDTMLVMNLEQEFNDSRDWVANDLNFDLSVDVNFFETTIRVLGGLLSAYHLSNDDIFLLKAKELGDKLVAAFNTPLKLPYSDVNLRTGEPKLPAWSSDCSLSEISTVQLEFKDLSYLTNNAIYGELAYNVSLYLHNLGCRRYSGLCPMYIDPDKGTWRKSSVLTLGARSDSYYEYLLKQFIQTGKKTVWLKNDYLRSVVGIMKHLIKYSEPSKLMFIGEILADGSYSPKMDHLVCFYAGTLALGAYNKLPHYQTHMKYAKDLANTCYKMYELTATGLGPEIVHFNHKSRGNSSTTKSADIFIKTADAHSLLRPEAVEAWFYLYRITGDKLYQDWGWNVFQALEKHAKVEHGYSSVLDVRKVPVAYKDKMESFFLSETLKYLYLLFDDDRKTLPLDQFVFNTEAHPLPIH